MAKPAALTVAILVAGSMLVAAGVAAALVLLGNDIFGPSVHALSQAQVHDELAAQRSVSGSGPASGAPGSQPPSSSPSVTPPTAVPTARTFTGGTVYAACSGTQVMLTGRVPAPGYAIAGVSPGPATAAWVRFTSGSSAENVTVTCVSGHPSFASATGAAAPDDHGGAGHEGGDDHGGRGGKGGGPSSSTTGGTSGGTSGGSGGGKGGGD